MCGGKRRWGIRASVVLPIVVFALPALCGGIPERVVELAGTRSRNGWTYYGGPMMPNAVALDPAGGAVWLGTSVGLVRYDLKTGKAQRWSTLDGLLDNYVCDLTFDVDGNLWLATFSGAGKFDGQKFTNWGRKKLGHDWLSSVAVDGEGRTWVGCMSRFAKGAFCLMPSGTWAVYNGWALHENGGFPNVINDIAPDPKGGVWLCGSRVGIEPLAGYFAPSASDSKLYFVDHYGTVNFAALPKVEGKTVAAAEISFDDAGNLVLRTWDGGLFGLTIKAWYDAEGVRTPNTNEIEWTDLRPKLGIEGTVGTLYRDPGGRLWIAATSGIGRVVNGKFTVSIPPPTTRWNFRRAYWHFVLRLVVLADGREAICFGCRDKGLYHWKEGKWTRVVNKLDGPALGGRSYPIIGSTGRGPDGKMYFTRNSTTVFDGKTWVEINHRVGLTYDKRERLKGISWYDGEKKEWVIQLPGKDTPVTFGEAFGRPCKRGWPPEFYPRFVDSRGHYWEALNNVLEFTGKQFIDHGKEHPWLLRPYKTYYSKRAGDIGEDAQGRIWVATQWGLLRYGGDRKWKMFGCKFRGMLGQAQWMWACNGIDRISFGGPWGSSDYDITKDEWRNYTYEKYDMPGVIPEYPGTMIEYVAPDLEGRLWYGFYEAGVCVREKDGSLTQYTTEDGLANCSVWGIWADDDGTMWFNTRAGTSHFDPKAFVRGESEGVRMAQGEHPAPKAVALAFLGAASKRSFEALQALMTDDHVFAFNEEETRGAKELEKAWTEWWAMVPDLKLEAVQVLAADRRVVVQLTSKGTCAVKDGRTIKGEWSYPVIAIVTVRDGKVAEWREFGDASPLNKLME